MTAKSFKKEIEDERIVFRKKKKHRALHGHAMSREDEVLGYCK
jgi:hypothetical protein